jgi:hypothetical protein
MRPSWHIVVKGSSTGAVLFAVARDRRLTDAGVLNLRLGIVRGPF